MFKVLKDKLKSAISKFAENTQEDAVEETIESEEQKQEKVEEVKEEPEIIEEKKEVIPEKTEEAQPSISEDIINTIKQEEPIEQPENSQEEITQEDQEPEKTEDYKDEIVEQPAEEIKEGKKGFFGKLKDKFKKDHEEPVKQAKQPIDTEEIKEEPIAEPPVEEEKAEEKPTEEEVTAEKLEDISPDPEKESSKETQPEEEVPEISEEKQEEKKEQVPEEVKKEAKPEPAKQPEKEKELPKEEKKGFFTKIKSSIQTVKLGEERFDELFWDIELALLENSVAVEVIEKIKEDLKQKLVDNPIRRKELDHIIIDSLTESIKELFEKNSFDMIKEAKKKKPYVICFIGINGSGKTTTIAKVAHLFKQNKMSCVLAAADTFRAAAIDQLKLHAEKLDIKIISQDYGSDAAAVAFDAIKHAEAKKKDIVLIDTAGRLHSNQNLMDEMKKIIKVANPDLTIFVGESITGNDCVEQAKIFSKAVNIDGIILSKADIDEKGGAAISISRIIEKPILYLGIGQEYSDLKKFDSSFVLENLGLS